MQSTDARDSASPRIFIPCLSPSLAMKLAPHLARQLRIPLVCFFANRIVRYQVFASHQLCRRKVDFWQ